MTLDPAAGAAAPVIPDFIEDERVIARYDAMLQRRIKDFFAEHLNSIRRNASAKSDALRDELSVAQGEWETRKAVADAARESYRAAYPHRVKKLRLEEPSMLEQMRSRGAAKKRYQSAEDAWRAAEHAASDVRRIEHNETQLDVELQKALERAPQTSKDVTESEKWLAEIHAEEELGNVKTKVDAILAQREEYAQRLAAGTVSDEEIRLRAFSAAGIKAFVLPIDGIIFLRVEQFGPKTYFIVRDLRKGLFALPYDRRLEPLLGGVIDIARAGKELEVRRSMRADGHTPLALLEHFTRCCDNDATAAQDAYRRHQEFVKERRMLSTMTEVDETEARAITLLAAYAAAQAT